MSHKIIHCCNIDYYTLWQVSKCSILGNIKYKITEIEHLYAHVDMQQANEHTQYFIWNITQKINILAAYVSSLSKGVLYNLGVKFLVYFGG